VRRSCGKWRLDADIVIREQLRHLVSFALESASELTYVEIDVWSVSLDACYCEVREAELCRQSLDSIADEPLARMEAESIQ
jgi:hypothetical protein